MKLVEWIFEGLAQSLRRLFSAGDTINDNVNDTDALDAERQLQAEFAAALAAGTRQQGMVTTRSQDNSLPDTGRKSRNGREPRGHGGKKALKKSKTRKSDVGAENAASSPVIVNGIDVNATVLEPQQAKEVQVVVEATGRLQETKSTNDDGDARRVLAAEEEDTVKPASKKEGKARKKHKTTKDDGDTARDRNPSNGSHLGAFTEDLDPRGTYSPIEVLAGSKSKEGQSVRSQSSLTTSTELENAQANVQPVGLVARGASHEDEEEAVKNGAHSDSNKATLTSRPKHKRFNENDEIEASGSQKDNPTDGNGRLMVPSKRASIASDEDSDDDAPEEFTAAAGAEEAKAAAVSIAQAVKKQAEDEKAKRKKRDQNLKEQAKASKKRKLSQRGDPEFPIESVPNAQDRPKTAQEIANEVARSILQSGQPLPSELPDEIFAVDPLPSVYSAREASIQEKPVPRDPVKEASVKRKRLEAESKPIKDIQYGDTRVRVLSQHNRALAPAAVKDSANMKEQWLRGRRKVEVAGYRQQGTKSFLRR